MRVDLIGRGWSFPVQPNPARDITYTGGAEKVVQSLLIILDTEPGERVMRPGFGCGLRRFLMRPNTAATRALIEREVRAALALWEQRIEVDSVEVLPHDREPARVDIHIRYLHAPDRRPGSLVYPFYLE